MAGDGLSSVLAGLPTRYRVAMEQVVEAARAEFGDDLLGLLLAGSLTTGKAMTRSDLDVFVLHRSLWRQRRTRWIGDVEVELFVNPPQRIADEIRDAQSSATQMFATGLVVHDPEGVVADLVDEAQQALDRGPASPGPDRELLLKYFATDLLKDTLDLAEHDPAAAELSMVETLAATLRGHYELSGRRIPKGKYLLADLSVWNAETAATARQVLDSALSLEQRLERLEHLVTHVLDTHGGLPREWESSRESIAEDGTVAG